ncbi:MAG: transglutaminase-like domain-containing protein [Chloroherpetonaceae bacterium]|nr:transglutaminase-like domain-containing protein [Chloroherpetonaceae bacterium]MDW8437575.1 transglutaminase-like domain-containing protein [Chloroherpetonaceae bacterium]
MKSKLNPQLSAMISLLDDDDNAVFQSVSQKLREVVSSDNPEAAEVMRLMVEKRESVSGRAAARIAKFIDDIQFQKLEPKFRRALLDNAKLEDFCFLIGQIGYPSLDVQKYKQELNRIESVIRLEYASSQTTAEIDRVFMLSNVVFERESYRGNSSNYYDPDNSYINRVIDRKLGIPISLGAIVLILAERLGLPVYGVNMPAHFMLKYERQNFELFIDPFNQGRILDKQDCIRFLMNQGYGHAEQYLVKANAIDIVERMFNNLRNCYAELAQNDKRALIERYLDIIYDARGEKRSAPYEDPEDDDFDDLEDDLNF